MGFSIMSMCCWTSVNANKSSVHTSKMPISMQLPLASSYSSPSPRAAPPPASTGQASSSVPPPKSPPTAYPPCYARELVPRLVPVARKAVSGKHGADAADDELVWDLPTWPPIDLTAASTRAWNVVGRRPARKLDVVVAPRTRGCTGKSGRVRARAYSRGQ